MSTSKSTEKSLHEQTQQLVDGPLKHIKAAALAAALLPLASVAAAPAAAQSGCASAGVCGTVFNDSNRDGIKDPTETGIEGVKVFYVDGGEVIETWTGSDGFYALPVDSSVTLTISVMIPTGMQPSPTDVGGDDAFDSDGVPDGNGFSVATSEAHFDRPPTDFGFFPTPMAQPGTGTPGYWKNHPAAWPVSTITVGGVQYTKAEAISWLNKVGKDKTTTMFSSLVPAMLHVLIGNDGSCVSSAIATANSWMATYGPVGSGVSGTSPAWREGEPTHLVLDAYNNGRLCAPHRR